MIEGRRPNREEQQLSTSMEHQTSYGLSYGLVPANTADICIRPCYYLLQALGMWLPRDRRHHDGARLGKTVREIYYVLIHLLFAVSLAAVMLLDFIHYGFTFSPKGVHIADLMNSVPTCLNLLCPYVFTRLYFSRGQYTELVLSIQNQSTHYASKLRAKARLYTLISVTAWCLSAAFFIFHWKPFFSRPWHYVLYIVVIIYTTGWWAVWLSIYAFVCYAHSLQIHSLVECMRSEQTSPVQVLYMHQQLRNSIDRTQRDFNFIISFAISYHALDIIIFSFAYYDDAFGRHYALWQYAGGVIFDLGTILVKLFPPAVLAAAVHRSLTAGARRCEVTPGSERLPKENLLLFQYMVSCERDMGLKILGIRITVEIVGTILMTIVTAAVSFVAFVIPRLK
ncbi:uncharacterized protein LOC114536579 [Dendronephthya gigantea]|uniref:uncharacterized protein LOC114536579 n=1 Tax=Dendronephthya gigantea TaxID=151771 RepID=UPI001068D9EF|nr:uncharacterized protein LOC114536579 [Dendronephthya gigantea]